MGIATNSLSLSLSGNDDVMTEVQIRGGAIATNSPFLSGNDDVMTEVQILLASDGASRLTPSLSLSGNDDVMTEVQILLASDGASRLTPPLFWDNLNYLRKVPAVNEWTESLSLSQSILFLPVHVGFHSPMSHPRTIPFHPRTIPFSVPSLFQSCIRPCL